VHVPRARDSYTSYASETTDYLTLLPSLNTLVKKKPHYIIVPTKEAKLKKNIIGNIGEQNIVKGKRIKG
jgi:hypothetical protein